MFRFSFSPLNDKLWVINLHNKNSVFNINSQVALRYLSRWKFTELQFWKWFNGNAQKHHNLQNHDVDFNLFKCISLWNYSGMKCFSSVITIFVLQIQNHFLLMLKPNSLLSCFFWFSIPDAWKSQGQSQIAEQKKFFFSIKLCNTKNDGENTK